MKMQKIFRATSIVNDDFSQVSNVLFCSFHFVSFLSDKIQNTNLEPSGLIRICHRRVTEPLSIRSLKINLPFCLTFPGPDIPRR